MVHYIVVAVVMWVFLSSFSLLVTYLRSVGPCWIKGRGNKNVILKVKREFIFFPIVEAKTKKSHLLTLYNKIEISNIRIYIGILMTGVFAGGGAMVFLFSTTIGSGLVGMGVYILKKFIIDELYNRAELICYAEEYGDEIKAYRLNYIKKMSKKAKSECPK